MNTTTLKNPRLGRSLWREASTTPRWKPAKFFLDWAKKYQWAIQMPGAMSYEDVLLSDLKK